MYLLTHSVSFTNLYPGLQLHTSAALTIAQFCVQFPEEHSVIAVMVQILCLTLSISISGFYIHGPLFNYNRFKIQDFIQ